jgi:phage-related holin
MKDSTLNSLGSNAGGIAAFFLAFFTPIFPAMLAAGILIICDTVTGIMKARKQGQVITSKELSAILTKMLLYQLLIISAHICELYMVDEIPFVKLVLGTVALVEFKSILENASVILGYDLFSEIMNKFKRK